MTLHSRDAFKTTYFAFDAGSSADSTMGDRFVKEVLSLCLQRLAIEEATYSELGKILLSVFSNIILSYLIFDLTLKLKPTCPLGPIRMSFEKHNFA